MAPRAISASSKQIKKVFNDTHVMLCVPPASGEGWFACTIRQVVSYVRVCVCVRSHVGKKWVCMCADSEQTYVLCVRVSLEHVEHDSSQTCFT